MDFTYLCSYNNQTNGRTQPIHKNQAAAASPQDIRAVLYQHQLESIPVAGQFGETRGE